MNPDIFDLDWDSRLIPDEFIAPVLTEAQYRRGKLLEWKRQGAIRGYGDQWAAHTFKEVFGVLPEKGNLKP